MKRNTDDFRSDLNENFRERYDKLGFFQKKMIRILENVSVDYFTFLTGIASALVIEEVYAFFGEVFEKNVESIVRVFNIILLLSINVLLIRFSVRFSSLKAKIYEKHESRKSRMAYLFEYYEDEELQLGARLKSLRRGLILVLVFVLMTLILNVWKWFEINGWFYLCFLDSAHL